MFFPPRQFLLDWTFICVLCLYVFAFFIIQIKVIGSCIRNQWCPTIANNNCMEKGVGRLKKGSISTLFWMLKKASNMPWYVNKTTSRLVLGGRHWAHSPKELLITCSNNKTTANHISGIYHIPFLPSSWKWKMEPWKYHSFCSYNMPIRLQ